MPLHFLRRNFSWKLCANISESKKIITKFVYVNSFKTGVYSYFKISSMGSDVQSLQSFTSRTVLFKLVLHSKPCFYAFQENAIKQNGIDKIIVDPRHFNQVVTVFRLPDGSNISVISFVSFHPQYHGVSVDMFSIGRIPIIYHNNRIWILCLCQDKFLAAS